MKKALVLSALFLVASVSFASASGINLGLSDCASAGLPTNAVPNCTLNTGIALSLVGSAIAPPGMDHVVGCDALIDVQTSGAALSPWWTLDGCRSGVLGFTFDFTSGLFTCDDFWAGQASAGGLVTSVHTAPNRFQIRVLGAAALENAMDSVTEYDLFRVIITRGKTTGAGSCAGCNDAACLVLSHVIIAESAGAPGGDATITNPLQGNFVTYAGGVVAGGCPGATPAQDRTWGQVKSLYR